MIQNFVARVLARNEQFLASDRPPQLSRNASGYGCRGRHRPIQRENEIESWRLSLNDFKVLVDRPFDSIEKQVANMNDKRDDHFGASSFTTAMGHVMDQYLSGRQEKMKAVGITTDGMWASSQIEEIEQQLSEFRDSPRRHDKQGNFRVAFNYAGNDERGLQQMLDLAFHFP
jgi:hypothetical protein